MSVRRWVRLVSLDVGSSRTVGMDGWPQGPRRSSPRWGFDQDPQTCLSFCAMGGVLFSASGVCPKDGSRRGVLGTGEWTTLPWLALETEGSGHCSMWPLDPSREKPHLSTRLTPSVPMPVCASGGPLHPEPGLMAHAGFSYREVGQHANSNLSCQGRRGVLYSASGPALCSNWR